MTHIVHTLPLFDFAKLRRHHVADQCVCCGSQAIQSVPAILMPFVAHRIFGWAPALIDETWGLNTVQTGMAYSVCKTLLCTNCGLLFSDIRFSNHELTNLYQDYRGEEYTTLREKYEPGYAQRNDALMHEIDYGEIVENFLEPLLDFPLSILDWGGDTGKNTPFKDRCKAFDIFDISNIDVIAGARSVNKQDALASKYDLVVCSNVLEHVPYPSDLLNDIKGTMHAESVLYIEVPYEEVIRVYGHSAITHKKHWHEHINFFSPTSLLALIANCGLAVLLIKHDASIVVGFKSSRIIQIACRLR